MTTGHIPFAVLVLAVCAASKARAQCSEWKGGFELPGTNGTVDALTTFDDGSGPALFVGGAFSSAGNQDTLRIARFDGEHWSALGAGVWNGDVGAMQGFDDGTGPALYVGGLFSTAGGNPASNIARWDGSTWSALGSGLPGKVFALCVFDDGSGDALYAGGIFNSGGPGSVKYVARWDGTTWQPLGTGVNSTVYALTVFDDGSGPALYAGGNFTIAGGMAANRIARWDGTSWSTLGAGLNGVVRALTSFDEGLGPTLYVGGGFTTAGGLMSEGIARWRDGVWSALESPFGYTVYSLAVHDDGSGSALYAGRTGWVSKWSGATWTTLSGDLNSGDARCLSVFDDGAGAKLYVGGAFSTAGGLSANGIARRGTSAWEALGTGDGIGPTTIDVPYAAAAFDDGTGSALYVGGSFHTAGDILAENVARWDGTSWSELGAGGTNGRVEVLKVVDIGSGPELFAGGYFTIIGGVFANHIARWDGTTWVPLGAGVGPAVSTVRALEVYDDGSGPVLYVGGGFTSAGGAPARDLAKWNGSTWTAIDTGFFDGNYIAALAVFDDGAGPLLYVGGDFPGDSAHGQRYISRWNGSTWWNFGLPPDALVRELAVYDDGTGPALYAGGAFLNAGGFAVHNIVRFKGNVWSDVGGGMAGGGGAGSEVRALTVFDEGYGARLYAGGDFVYAGGVEVHGIARWDGSDWSSLQTGLGSVNGGYIHVHDMAVFEDGSPGASGQPDLFVVGDFSKAGPYLEPGVRSFRVAAWQGCGHPGEIVCLGDGTGAACPCDNYGLPGHGCRNSSQIRGAELTASGLSSLIDDSLAMASAFEPHNVTSIFLQGDQLVSPVPFGDGLRCAGGHLKRLYTVNATSGGTASVPPTGGASISARSLALGDAIDAGTLRVYQMYYRDSNLAFCPEPLGNSWNVSNGLRVGWTP